MDAPDMMGKIHKDTIDQRCKERMRGLQKDTAKIFIRFTMCCDCMELKLLFHLSRSL